MTERFRGQGGAAGMDPGPLIRWLTSAIMTRLSASARVDKRRAAAEKQRIKHGAPHRVEYFHQVDDGYSHLAAQVFQRLGERLVMRGVPATREKGLYIFMDAAREAREAGVPCGNFYDPIGDPARHCCSLYPWAVEQGNQILGRGSPVAVRP